MRAGSTQWKDWMAKYSKRSSSSHPESFARATEIAKEVPMFASVESIEIATF